MGVHECVQPVTSMAVGLSGNISPASVTSTARHGYRVLGFCSSVVINFIGVPRK